MKFTELEFKKRGPNAMGNEQAKVFFPNGFGASVVRGPYTYGGSEGKYELAVLEGTIEKHGLCYTTRVTSDVEGGLEPADVTKLLSRIKRLKDRRV